MKCKKITGFICIVLAVVIAVPGWATDVFKALPPHYQELTVELLKKASIPVNESPPSGALVPVRMRGQSGKLVEGVSKVPWAAIGLMLAGAAVWVNENWDHVTDIKTWFELASVRPDPNTAGAFQQAGTGTLHFTVAEVDAVAQAQIAAHFQPTSPEWSGSPAVPIGLYPSLSACGGTQAACCTTVCGCSNVGLASTRGTAPYTVNVYGCYNNGVCGGTTGWKGFYMIPSGTASSVTTIPGEYVSITNTALVNALNGVATNSANNTATLNALNQLISAMNAASVGTAPADVPGVTTSVTTAAVPSGYTFPGNPTDAGGNFTYQIFNYTTNDYQTTVNNNPSETTINEIPESDTSWLKTLLDWFHRALGLDEAPPDSGGVPPTDHGADEGDPTPGENQKQILLIPDDPDPDANPMGPDRGAVQEKQNTFLANLLGELVDLTAGFRSEVSGLMSGLGSGNSQCAMTGTVFGVEVPINFCQINFGAVAPIITTMFCVACLLIIIGG